MAEQQLVEQQLKTESYITPSPPSNPPPSYSKTEQPNQGPENKGSNSRINKPDKETSSRVRMAHHSPTMFGLVPERCVTFCIDTSGSMFQSLDVVKEHLMETLLLMASRTDEPMFNLIEFNSQVTQWADKLVQCTPEIVSVAGKWVSELQAKTGTNTQDALLTALADPLCHAIYLVTDGLPDQYAEEVLDNVVGMCNTRRIHCIYITGEKADDAATDFLEDLAVETFGSFHIVTLTTHGCVERITPVYRSDYTHEKVVYTVNNTMRPNVKSCSVATTLQIDPDEVLGLTPHARSLLLPAAPLLTYPASHRYYYPYYWSRYRPAKAYLKAQDTLADPLFGLSPSAGSLLVGKKVIARRIEDGYFYRAAVQSQNLGEKFLIAFGPCKHGKYQQTEYQDTFVFDIVDYYDAIRHTIITGDEVLAPWEPEGERFAPGIVIDGQEKRHAEGPDDKMLTVTFSHGCTSKVALNTAVWIPPSLYDRLSLELQMPKETRQKILSVTDHYPLENLPGYPTSGPLADPPEYPYVNPFLVESSPLLWDPYLYRYSPYLPAYFGYPSFVLKTKTDKKMITTNEDNTKIIPGTEMTNKELEERVMSQLMEHRLTGESTKSDSQLGVSITDKSKADSLTASGIKESAASRLLSKRESLGENAVKKKVHFSDSRRVETVCDMEDYLDDSAFDDYGNPKKKADLGVNTDSSLLFYHSKGISGRPRWNKYCYNNSCCSEESKCSSCTRPFRETALQAPLEARDQRMYPCNVEWTSPAFKYVDTFAKHERASSVQECLQGVKAPNKSYKNLCHSNVALKPTVMMTQEEREESRRQYRLKRVIQREAEWQQRLKDTDNVKALMQDHHRERVLSQMERDRQRQIKEQNDIQRIREAKKQISAQLRTRIESNQTVESQKEEKRLEALRRRRERRELIQTQHDKEIEKSIERKELIRKQNNTTRLSAWTTHLDEEEAKTATLNKQHQEAKERRIQQFREKEKISQQKKDLRIAVTQQSQALYRSQIFA